MSDIDKLSVVTTTKYEVRTNEIKEAVKYLLQCKINLDQLDFVERKISILSLYYSLFHKVLDRDNFEACEL